ncbi:MAG: hypothetical protein C0490_28385 [Marivirga sp.]|nr:hypothetical protein [Marivirga sp.]
MEVRKTEVGKSVKPEVRKAGSMADEGSEAQMSFKSGYCTTRNLTKSCKIKRPALHQNRSG